MLKPKGFFSRRESSKKLTVDEAKTQVNEIYELVNEKLDKCDSLDDVPLQIELATLVSILPDVARTRNEFLIKQAIIVARSVLKNDNNIVVARKINRNIQKTIMRKYSPIEYYVGQMVGPIRMVLSGMFLFTLLAAVFYKTISSALSELAASLAPAIPMDQVVIAAAAGGIASIATRLNQFSGKYDARNTELFFTGFFKPLVGVAFGLFFCALISGEFLPIKITKNENLFFVSIAFLAGFSERFARDMVGRAEGAVLSNDNSNMRGKPTGKQ